MDCYIRFWNSHGHPPPYRTQSEAENCLTLSDLCKLSDIHREAADLIMEYKAQLHIGRRIELVSLIMNALPEVKAGNALDNNTETIRKVRQLLQQYNLTQEEMKPVNNAMETDQSEYNNTLSQCSQSTSGNHVDLWPLHDQMFVLSELKLVNKMLTSSECTASPEVGALVNYGIQFTPVSPIVLTKLKAKCEDKSQEAVSNTLCEILCDMYQQLWTNTSATGLNWWLNWYPSLESMASSVDRTKESLGPKSLYKAVLSKTAYHLMCGKSEETQRSSQDRHLTVDVPLRDLKSRLHKLQILSQHIWSQGSMLCKGNLQTRILLRQHIVQVFVSILHSTVAMFKSKEAEDKYKQSVSEFINCLQNKDTSHSNSEQIIQTITNLLNGVMGPDLFIVRECLSGILAVSDDEADMRTVGRQWVYVGLLGMLLHKPRSPVDPVVKTQIKLQLKQRELEEINTDIEVKTIHHRQMTGLHLLDTPSHLQHPLILHLIYRREKLQRQIEALQSQHAYRPSTCQKGARRFLM
ncbi:uncharacterized protein LOC134245069 [Saccostrea cucullata]|uniref:uncharacterized protein LOC134245069 n=1 Tax=Saccostrea cuccullata TaxID=36930 RepID=UPI002ED0DAB4